MIVWLFDLAFQGLAVVVLLASLFVMPLFAAAAWALVRTRERAPEPEVVAPAHRVRSAASPDAGPYRTAPSSRCAGCGRPLGDCPYSARNPRVWSER